MSKKYIVSILFFSITISFFAQKSINDYKYIIVPTQFEFQKSEDQYQLNSLTKFLFNKYGFTAFISNEVYPEDFGKNKCLGLTARLNKDKNMFVTKMSFELINCNNVVVFRTKEGFSKDKNFETAYQNALRMSFNFIRELNYKYMPKKDSLEVKTDTRSEENIIDEVIIVKEIKEIEKSDEVVNETSDLFYAQPIKNGFQLIDNISKKVYLIIKETSVKDVFILEDKNGILYRLGDYWIAEYYDFNQLVEMKLNIKF